MTAVMHWFRRDLRISDNPALNLAASSAQASGSALLCVYCHDTAHDAHLPWGAARTSRFRESFLRETLDSLIDSLKAKGSFLLEVHGPSAATIAQCAHDFKVTEIWFQPEVAPEEIEQEMSLQQMLFESGIKLISAGSGSLIEPAFGPFNALTLPDLFTHFRIEAEKKGKFPEPVSAPAYFPPPPKDAILFGKIGSNLLMNSQANKVAASHAHLAQTSQFVGGENCGLKRVHDYFWETDAVLTYFKTRNALEGINTSTGFSPWLSNGSISSRRILAELKTYERERGSNKSTYW
jgi:deoxyribodipyrimidine photo-lyase